MFGHITAINQRLDRIEAILRRFIPMEGQMAIDLSKLTADVSAQSDVIKSAQAAIAGLQQAIVDLKSQVSPDPQTQAAIDALATQVEQNSSALASAIPANTAPAAAPAPSAPSA
jgi:small-conductance mechanosensitive channel